MSKYDRRSRGTQGGFDHSPNVHRGLRGSAFADHLLLEKLILPIEKERYDDLVSSGGESRLEVGGNRRRRVERTGSRRIGPETFPELEGGLDLRHLGDAEAADLEEIADVRPSSPCRPRKSLRSDRARARAVSP